LPSPRRLLAATAVAASLATVCASPSPAGNAAVPEFPHVPSIIRPSQVLPPRGPVEIPRGHGAAGFTRVKARRNAYRHRASVFLWKRHHRRYMVRTSRRKRKHVRKPTLRAFRNGAPPNQESGTSSELTFAEECDATSIDPAKWLSEWGVYFGTDVDFMGDGRQISMGGGLCTITAERKPTPSGRQWASGLMSTRHRFSQAYGRFEIRAKLPKGQGLWPAFWLLPQDPGYGPPEIDVMEAWTNPIGTAPIDAATTSSHIHYGPPGYEPDLFHSIWYKADDFTQDFHTYAVEWRPGSLTMVIDGVVRGQITQNVPSTPMYLIVNLAVGQKWGGRPDASTPSPSHLLIDYMRVYR
jgi:hypothetical protein